MSDVIVNKSEQLVLIVIQHYNHRPQNLWFGCLEMERGEYSFQDIMRFANDDPETIDRVLVIKGSTLKDITDDVIEWEERSRGI